MHFSLKYRKTHSNSCKFSRGNINYILERYPCCRDKTSPNSAPILSDFFKLPYIVQLYMYFPTLLKSNYAIELKFKNFLEPSALVFSRPIKKSFLRRGFVCHESRIRKFFSSFGNFCPIPPPPPPPTIHASYGPVSTLDNKKQHKTFVKYDPQSPFIFELENIIVIVSSYVLSHLVTWLCCSFPSFPNFNMPNIIALKIPDRW